MVIGKWKIYVSGKAIWKPIKIDHNNSLKKYCKIVCTYNITQQIIICSFESYKLNLEVLKNNKLNHIVLKQ